MLNELLQNLSAAGQKKVITLRPDLDVNIEKFKSMYSIEKLGELYEKNFPAEIFSGEPHGLYDPVVHIMSIGGKRIRPLLCLLSADMFGNNPEKALHPAFGVEVFHNFTLVHDDIMDNADLRRGQPAVHTLYGLNKGILSGDVMFAYAYKYVTSVDANILPDIVHTFNKTAIEIFEGQQNDMDFEVRNDVTEQEYLKMIEFKTSVLLGCALKLGAIIGGASKQDQDAIYNFGINLGLSFQIKDDFLDTFGESAKVGKRIGGDILNNKKTYLYLNTKNMASEADKAILEKMLTEVDEVKKIDTVKQIMERSGAKQKTQDLIEFYFQEALKNLEDISVSDEQKVTMKTLSNQINKREF